MTDTTDNPIATICNKCKATGVRTSFARLCEACHPKTSPDPDRPIRLDLSREEAERMQIIIRARLGSLKGELARGRGMNKITQRKRIADTDALRRRLEEALK